MGVFVREDGHFRSWLAALLCCCAAVNEDEHPIEKKSISKPTTARNTIWNEQPTPLQPMRNHPKVLISSHKGIDASFDEYDLVRPIGERPPSLHRLDFGETSLLARVSLHARKKSSTTLLSRISIGRPTDSRRMDGIEKKRRSLVPLQLAPVSLADSMPKSLDVKAPHGDVSKSFEALVGTPDRDSYRASRGSPFLRCQRLSSSGQSSASNAAVSEQSPIVMEPITVPEPAKPVLSTKSSSSSMRSLRRQALDSSASNSSAVSRPSSERTRLTRKRSSQKNYAESTDLTTDKEILELNTIIEERRVEAARPQSPANAHVSAVAPLMQIRARSTTLTDIGSAFSRPLMSVPTTMESTEQCDPVVPQTMPPVTPVKSRLSQPFVSMPDPAVVEEKPTQLIRRPSSRMAGWLSSLLSSTNETNATNTAEESFYSCGPTVRRRRVSEASQCTVTELDSPAETTASSPTSKGRSRSCTSESTITPISPASTVDDMMHADLNVKSGEQWTVVAQHPAEVGLAL